MHRLPRWLVGTAASLLGLTLLIIREGFWLGGSTVVSGEGSPGKVRALLIAVQNEPAVFVYGAIAFFSGWFCPPNLHRKMEEMGDRSQGTKELIAILRREFASFSTLAFP